MEPWMTALAAWLALPANGLATVFAVALASATLLPLGSEPAVFALVQLNPGLVWPAILVATLGNTLGGAITWWMGLGTHRAIDRLRGKPSEVRVLAWLKRFGPRACLLSWLPVVGDPIRCAPWPDGCACRSGPASPTWPWANSHAICS